MDSGSLSPTAMVAEILVVEENRRGLGWRWWLGLSLKGRENLEGRVLGGKRDAVTVGAEEVRSLEKVREAAIDVIWEENFERVRVTVYKSR